MKPKPKPKFKVGQVVAHVRNNRVMGYFKIGAIDQGTSCHWYTADKTNRPPYYTEATLRALTKREAGQ